VQPGTPARRFELDQRDDEIEDTALSLNGNLEDLPLLDIIQIVTFSKKTGSLSIRTRAGDGAIVFRDGFIASAFTWDSIPLDPRARSLPPSQRERLLRNRIELSLEQLIRLREGEFSFNLVDEVPSIVGVRDISEETLTQGLNAQEVLLDLARGMDEDRRDSAAALEASFAEAPPAAIASSGPEEEAQRAQPPGEAPARLEAPPPPPGPSPEPARTLLLIDDEDDVRRVLAQHFAGGGYQVVEAESPDAAAKKAGDLSRGESPFILVVDLGMPTSGGASFQGGFEVVKRMWKMGLRPPVLLMADSFGRAIQARARQMGVSSVVFKPGLSKLDPEQFEADLKAFAHKLLSDVLPRLSSEARAGAAPAKPPAQVPRALSLPAPRPHELERELLALQERFDELRQSGGPAQISAAVMKMAREFFERGLLFLVKNEELRGLGGFGRAPGQENLNLLARDILIPLSEPSFFADTVAGKKPQAGPLPADKWCRHLMGKIGRFRSVEVALLPLLTNRETIALLFGDNPETGRGMGRLDSLALFMNQAGIALENAFLQVKLRALQNRQLG
jgi:CheY-like chemotaxis protein